jgi:hypothetical protein
MTRVPNSFSTKADLAAESYQLVGTDSLESNDFVNP